jgi:hypothetical protein
MRYSENDQIVTFVYTIPWKMIFYLHDHRF